MNHKIAEIAKTLNIPEHEVALVLYTYLADCMQDLLLNGTTNTLFGKLKLLDNNEIQFENNKFEFDNDLFSKKDLLSIMKVVEYGPGAKLFPI